MNELRVLVFIPLAERKLNTYFAKIDGRIDRQLLVPRSGRAGFGILTLQDEDVILSPPRTVKQPSGSLYSLHKSAF